jgi:CheY-like chemotaxis protein
MHAPDVLLVEDDEPTRRCLGTLLGRLGLTTVGVPNGAAALRCLNEQTFGVVLLDLFMPDMSGAEVLASVARSDARVLRRIIVLTAASRSAVDAIVQRYGVRAVLRKPFDISELAAEVLDCLTERERPSKPRRRSVSSETRSGLRPAFH